MMQRVRVISVAVALAGVVTASGCSSSTEPKLRNSADGLSVHLDFTPRSPKVGDVVTATLTIVNANDASISRTYPPHNFGPYVHSASGALVRSFSDGFGDVVDIGEPNEFQLAPQQSIAITAHFDAANAGNGELRGCLPGGDEAESTAICDEVFVAVSAK